MLRTIDARTIAIHASYLLAMLALGTLAARWTFTRKLSK